MRLTVKRLGDTYKVIWFLRGKKGDEGGDSLPEIETEEQKLANNLCRAKGVIRELAFCNPWEYFVTLTLDGTKQGRYDLVEYIHDLGNWIGNYNKRYGAKLQYLLIPEQHKDGAWHMHGLFNGVAAQSLVRNEHGYLDLPYYARRFGYISLSPIKDKNKCSSYITKYVTKEAGKAIALSKHLFYHSRGLQRAETIGEFFTQTLPPDVWRNDFVGVEYVNGDEALFALLARINAES